MHQPVSSWVVRSRIVFLCALFPQASLFCLSGQSHIHSAAFFRLSERILIFAYPYKHTCQRRGYSHRLQEVLLIQTSPTRILYTLSHLLNVCKIVGIYFLKLFYFIKAGLFYALKIFVTMFPRSEPMQGIFFYLVIKFFQTDFNIVCFFKCMHFVRRYGV